MYKLYPSILGIIDTLNEWNEKLNGIAGSKLNNVAFGTVVVGLVFAISVWGINTLNKK